MRNPFEQMEIKVSYVALTVRGGNSFVVKIEGHAISEHLLFELDRTRAAELIIELESALSLFSREMISPVIAE